MKTMLGATCPTLGVPIGAAVHALLSKSRTQILAAFRARLGFLFAVDPRFRYQIQRGEDEPEHLHGDESGQKAGPNSRAKIPVGEDAKAEKDQAGEYK
jgi:hypothetical protein